LLNQSIDARLTHPQLPLKGSDQVWIDFRHQPAFVFLFFLPFLTFR
jgi:hypothetical protein